MPVTQETDLRNQGKFFAEVHEDALDKLTMLIQQVRSWFSLALRKPSFAANYYDAMDNYIRNLRAPSRPKDAATKDYVDILSGASLSRSLRVPESFINELPDADGRKNKTLSFDNSGSPLLLDPESSGLWGYSLIDSFQDGASITTRFQALHWKRPDGNGEYYRWDGSLPKDVPENSTPESTGGVSLGAWVSVGDASLRSDLISQETDKGSSIVTYTPKFNDAVSMSVSEKLSVDLVTLSDYGFKVGNTGAQNKAAFQAAIDDAVMATELVIPPGEYICDPGVTIGNSNIIRIRGAGMYQTVIFTAGEADPLITQAAGKIVTFCEFIDFGLNGNYKANTLLNLTEANHIKIIRVQFANTIGNALVLNGYSNDIEGCRFMENNGNAVTLGGVLNNTNFVNNRVYGNNVGGLILHPSYDEGGLSVRIQGNDFELNKSFGLMAYGIKGLNIIDNYWERNGENGFNYPDIGGVTVKADLHLIANSYSITPNAVKANDVVRVCGNHQTAFGYGNTLGNQDAFVFTNYAKNLCVEHNEMLDPSKNNALISVYNSHYVTIVTDEVHIRGNSRNDIGFIGAAQDVYDHIRWGHLIRNFNAPRPINLLENSMLSWFRFAGSTGSLLKTTNYFNNNYSFSVTDGDSVWATTIDLSLRPELKDKYIWFGAWVNDQGASAKLLFGINSKYSDDLTVVAGSGSWKFVSCCTYVGPGDTVIRATIQKIGSGADVLINSPVIAELGVSYTDVQSKPTVFRAPSVPTTGAWNVGERVINSAPASGQPKAWTCNIPGGPGVCSFLSEGNY